VNASVNLATCYGGYVTLEAVPGVIAVVDTGGLTVAFVDELTLAVELLSTDRDGDPDAKTRLISWLEGDGTVLVLAYGRPIVGDIVRVNLKTRKTESTSTPRVCR
jgi:hypothetical protein